MFSFINRTRREEREREGDHAKKINSRVEREKERDEISIRISIRIIVLSVKIYDATAMLFIMHCDRFIGEYITSNRTLPCTYESAFWSSVTFYFLASRLVKVLINYVYKLPFTCGTILT